jgi:MFS family permease
MMKSVEEETGDENAAHAARGYFNLIRENKNFRRLWLGQIVSQLGDWFNTIALYSIALKLTGSGKTVALILTTRFLSTVFSSPVAGVVADRFDRKRIMVVADVLRGVTVLGFLLVRRPEDVWLIYVLTVLQLVLSTFFEPARAAAIPAVVEPRDLLTANAITAATWSAMLTLGAAIGGFVAATLGTDGVFVVDSATYLVSAILILGIRLPKRAIRERQKLSFLRATGLLDVYEGLKYVCQRPRVFATMLAKPAAGIGGAMLTLLAVFGEKIYPVGGSSEIGIGILYGVRGVGTALAPVFLQRLIRPTRENLENCIGISFFVCGIFFALFGLTTNYWLAIAMLLAAYAGGSLIWTNSTVLLQKSVADDFRGRVFAAELAFLTLTLAASNYAVGELLDSFDFEPRAVTVALGILAAAPGAIWFLTRTFWRDANSVESD